jgi:hypothetical protein
MEKIQWCLTIQEKYGVWAFQFELARYVILDRTGMPRHHIFPELLNTTVSFPYSLLIEEERAYAMKLIPDTHPIA